MSSSLAKHDAAICLHQAREGKEAKVAQAGSLTEQTWVWHVSGFSHCSMHQISLGRGKQRS